MTDKPKCVQWSDTLLVGHADIDEEHKGIFALATKLQETDIANAPSSLASETIYKLVEYASTHLGHEEELMWSSRYPFINGHTIEHWKFFNQLTTIIDDYERGRPDVVTKCVTFITSWLEKHILVNDIQLADFLKRKDT